MPFRGTGLVQARGCNVERAESGDRGGQGASIPGGEGSRPKRGGRKGVVALRGGKGLGY